MLMTVASLLCACQSLPEARKLHAATVERDQPRQTRSTLSSQHGNLEASVPYAGLVRFSEDWPELTQRRLDKSR